MSNPISISYPTPLLTALEQLAPPGHLCSIYETEQEQFAVAMPFVRIGLERREKCIYIADDGPEAAIRDAMHAEGIDFERAIANDSLVVRRKETAYLKQGAFDPDWVFSFWGAAADEALRQGYTGLRVTGETEWVLRGGPGLERWLEYESRFTHALSRHRCVALCQYNSRVFSPELMLEVIRTHPTVIYRGAVCRNMYYVPPDELLGPHQARREVERLLRNISEREDVENALRRQRDELQDSAALFRQIAENVREVFWVWDTASERITFVTPMYEELFGLSCASLYADPRSHLDVVHPDDRSHVATSVNRSRSGQPIDVQFRIVRPDGSMRWARTRSFPVPNPTGPVTRVVGFVEDITEARNQLDERRRSLEELRASVQRWRSVFDNSAIGMVIGDAAANILATNQTFQTLLGYTGQELLLLNVYELTHPDDVARNVELRAELLAGLRREMQMEKRLYRKDRQAIWVRVTSTLVPGGDVTPDYVIALVEDITGRRLAERELDASLTQSRALGGRLMRAQDDERRRIAQMLHETTAQDLAGLKMLLARLKRSTDRLSESERETLAESITLAEQSMTEIRTLSYLLHPPFLDENGLLSAVRWYATGFAERSGIKVSLELPERFARLPRDTETALFRIVQESLINIHRHSKSETAEIRLRRDSESLVLEIGDRGRGIPKAGLRDMMHGGGDVGVGIAGMSERIARLGGTFEITSNTLGATGTTVGVRLPLGEGTA